MTQAKQAKHHWIKWTRAYMDALFCSRPLCLLSPQFTHQGELL